ncbi:MAG: DUF1592 domain-containing protein [Archangiaceae bacterium]|nr:DUF1592 domain-containing protein [Archangiaceae bacterium]
MRTPLPGLQLTVLLSLLGCEGAIVASSTELTPVKGAPDSQCTEGGPGRVPARRLNNVEYANTVRDLLYLAPTVDLTSTFPADTVALTAFDNDALLLDLPPERVDAYLHAALKAVEAAWSTSRSKLVPCDLAAGRACAAQALGALVKRAYRRPVTQDEVDALLGVYDASMTAGLGAETSLKISVQAMLSSPRFLFITNGVKDNVTTGTHHLNGYELASRLSYFLWRSMPDDALLAAAERGDLTTQAGVRAQVERMLAMPAAAVTTGFGSQWLSLTELGRLAVDLSGQLRIDMALETQALFDHVLRDKRPARELFTADYTFMNQNLASHYGVSGVSGTALTRVAVPQGQSRSGVLTHASILAVTAGSTVRTSPVVRGHWILEKVLCAPPPPPPAGIPALGETPGTSEGTMKERLAAHRTQPRCAACHERMDPVGLGFENYDMVGKWRTQYTDGSAIDPSGNLPGGEAFAGPTQLTSLLSSGTEMENCVTSNVMAFATGRRITTEDKCSIGSIARASFADGASLEDLLVNVATSRQFQLNVQEEP